MGDNKIWLENPQGKIAKGTLCPTCARYNTRDTCVHAVVVSDGKLLLIERGGNPMKGWWALPAGYLDWDETTEECVIRELKEEAGVDGRVVRLLGIYSDPARDEDGRQNIGIVYVVEINRVDKVRAGDDAEKASWFDLDSLPDKIAFDHRKMIEDYKRSAKEG